MSDPLADLPGGDVKLGGKSIYLYGAVIGAAVVIYMWATRRTQSQEAATATPAFVDSVPDVSGDLGDLPKAPPVMADIPDDTETNASWEIKSIAYLVTQGVAPTAAQQAIELYLNGGTLDYTKTTFLNKAIEKYGPPPEGLGFGSPIVTNTSPAVPEVKWVSKGEKWITVGAVNAYAGPSRSSRVLTVRKAGTKISTNQTAMVGGSRWVRNTSGTTYNVNDLRAAK